MSNSIDPLATLVAPVAAVILSAFCALLTWHQRRRLAAMQAQLENLSSAIRSLEADRERSFIRSLNLPKSRKARKSSSPSSDTLEEKTPAPGQPEDKNSSGYVVAPETSPK